MKINNYIAQCKPLEQTEQGECFFFSDGNRTDFYTSMCWDTEETMLEPVEYTEVYWPVFCLNTGSIEWASKTSTVVVVEAELNISCEVDLISRADVIEAVKHSTAYMHDDLYEVISRIPSAETTGALDDAIAKYVSDGLMELPSSDAKWIPCSERLPKKGEVVLITNGKGNVRCGQYRSEYDVRDGTHYWWWKGKTVESVIAWMPLPPSYRGE